MSARYKFTYFDVRGIGEPIRWTFLVGGIDFIDDRVPCENWASKEFQKTFKWRQLPFLTIDDDIEITQTVAIGNYIAKKCGLLPEDDLEIAKCTELVSAIHDLRVKWLEFYMATFENIEKKAELKTQLLENYIPIFLTQFNNMIKGKFLLGDKYYWADFFLASWMELFEESLEDPNLLKPYPALVQQKKNVFEIPQIKDWVAKRPKTFI